MGKRAGFVRPAPVQADSPDGLDAKEPHVCNRRILRHFSRRRGGQPARQSVCARVALCALNAWSTRWPMTKDSGFGVDSRNASVGS